VLLQIHGGCDARGGYTAPKAYRLYEEDTWGNWSINCYGTTDKQWDEDGQDQAYPNAGPRLRDIRASEFEGVSKDELKAQIEALKQTTHDNQATRDLMTKNWETNNQQAFREYCYDHPDEIVVFERKAYFVNALTDCEPQEIYADCYGLMG
jgi:hypothetical protein